MNTSLCEQRNTARGVDKYINIENRLLPGNNTK